jgi:hypothetical protein
MIYSAAKRGGRNYHILAPRIPSYRLQRHEFVLGILFGTAVAQTFAHRRFVQWAVDGPKAFFNLNLGARE